MAGFLKIVCKYCLYSLLLVGVGLGLVLFVWWMEWPLFSVAVMLGAIALLILLVMVVRQLRVWFNKRRYVHHVLTTDPSLLAQEAPSIEPSSITRAWERGMGVLRNSPRGRRENPVHTQPWVIQFGTPGSIACTASSGSEPLRWHFLPDMVLLELDDVFLSPTPTPEQHDAWEFLLSRLLETRGGTTRRRAAGTAPEALLATVDARALGGDSLEPVTSRARQLHARLRELQTLFEARIPLYVTVTGLEALPGMTSLLKTLSRDQRAELLGERFPLPDEAHTSLLSPEACAARAVDQAARTLRRALLTRAAEGFPPDGDELQLFSGLARLQQGLTVFLEPLFRLTPHMSAPLLRGIVFVAGTESHAIEQHSLLMSTTLQTTPSAQASTFTADLLSRVLPAERAIPQASGVSSLRERFWGLGFACWYLALFVFCGLTAATTVYNWNTLRNAPDYSAEAPADKTFQRLHYFEDALRRWWLPSLGLDRMEVEREAANTRYVTDMRQQIPATLLALTTAQGPRQKNEKQLELIQRLLWLSEAVDLRRSEGSAAALREQPFPAASGAETVWSTSFGDAFLNYLDRESPDALAQITTALRTALQRALGQNESQLFERLTDFVNANLAHKSVTLSEFWPNIPRGSTAFMTVPPAYTAAGFADLSRRMSRLYADGTESPFTDKPFWKHYLADYAAVWHNYALNADQAWNNESTLSTLAALTAETNLIKTPSARLLARMASELQPLAGQDAPSWVNDVFLLNAMVALVSQTGETDPGEKLGTLSILLGTLKTGGPALAQIRDYLVETRDARGVFRAIAALREYEQSLQELRRTQLSPEGSFTLAAMHFGGKQYGDAAQSACTQAEARLGEVFRLLHVRPETGRARPGQTQPLSLSPAVALLRGQLRLAMHGIISEAALELQRQWEGNVLSLMALAPIDPGPLFAEKGVVRQFLAERAAPFMDRKIESFVPRMWDGHVFPFTEDFLQYAQKGSTISQVTPKESYDVRLRSQTSSVNPEALERLQYVEVSLAGPEGTTTLKNQNYPSEKVFTYKPGSSGGVTLRLSFPTLTLTRNYTNFVEFLYEFAYGERIFDPQDFPQSAERMELLNINRVVVRLLPANASEVLAAQDITPIPLPERIVKVW